MSRKKQRLSVAEYAKRRGVSDQAVRNAIKAGRIKHGAKRNDEGRFEIDPEVADQEWASNTDPTKVRKQTQPKPTQAKPNPSQTQPKPTAPDADALEGPFAEGEIEILDRVEAEKRTASYKAHLAEIELLTARGLVVPVEEAIADIEAAVAAEYTAVRQRLLAIPARISKAVSLMESEAEVRRALDAAITEALCELTADEKTWEVKSKPKTRSPKAR